MRYHRKFKCVLSAPQGFLLLNRYGKVFECQSENPPMLGEDIWIALILNELGNFESYDFSEFNYTARQLDDAPQDVVNEIFN